MRVSALLRRSITPTRRAVGVTRRTIQGIRMLSHRGPKPPFRAGPTPRGARQHARTWEKPPQRLARSNNSIASADACTPAPSRTSRHKRTYVPVHARRLNRKADAVAQRHTETRGARPPVPKSTVATAARMSWLPVRRTHPAVRPTRLDGNPAASRVGTYYRLQYPLPARAPTPKPSIAAAPSASTNITAVAAVAHTTPGISTNTDHTQRKEARTRALSSQHIQRREPTRPRHQPLV
ncbi:hypothetical protein B0H16DRAFT_1546504 [Mycena metata]|uniref:Uncharacterized protein n=1 Tax=Mycena metata TaxID=1033252 RepID=A0AAD7MJD8_9AGAR|nr:hypothetical protein B0H16DRAFT_1604821 [Mycena metata]KAJ7752305.1 hypothetical protein B0H16DRAFT_1546504 [Mycena metata]